MKPSLPCTVVIEDLFLKESRSFWDEKELMDFITHISLNPLEGDEIQGTHGLRKIRWSRPGIGKRGGVRVIYYFYNEQFPIYLVTIYAKSQQEDLSAADKKSLAQWVQYLKKTLKE